MRNREIRQDYLGDEPSSSKGKFRLIGLLIFALLVGILFYFNSRPIQFINPQATSCRLVNTYYHKGFTHGQYVYIVNGKEYKTSYDVEPNMYIGKGYALIYEKDNPEKAKIQLERPLFVLYETIDSCSAVISGIKEKHFWSGPAQVGYRYHVNGKIYERYQVFDWEKYKPQIGTKYKIEYDVLDPDHSIIYLGSPTTIENGFTDKTEAKNLTANNLKEGKWIEYMDSIDNDTKNADAPYYRLVIYKSGKRIGIVRVYYKNDHLHVIATCVNGIANGPCKVFYETGKLKQMETYINDSITGPAIGYYENGSVEWKSDLLNGEQNGIDTEYDENGKLKATLFFNAGKANGIEKDYYENGKIKSETIWNNDIDGITREFDENGKEIKQASVNKP